MTAPQRCRRPAWRLLPANDNWGELAVREAVRLVVEDAVRAANDAQALVLEIRGAR